jgi:hypothetical protein
MWTTYPSVTSSIVLTRPTTSTGVGVGLIDILKPGGEYQTYCTYYCVLFLENKGTNSPPKMNTAQTYVQSCLMSLNVPPATQQPQHKNV